MKVGTLLRIVAQLIPILERHGVLDAADEFHEPSLEKIAALAADVESLLVQHGVKIDGNIDKVIKILPLVLTLAGVK